MLVESLLPIGSVVLLKGGIKRLMIIGIIQQDGEESIIKYDYLGVIYPEGNIGPKSQFFFNHSDVEDVCYLGFQDIERQKFIEKLASLYESVE